MSGPKSAKRVVLLHVHRLRLLALDYVDLLLRPVVGLYHALVEDVALPEQILDLLCSFTVGYGYPPLNNNTVIRNGSCVANNKI